jgi:hypothetical protein
VLSLNRTRLRVTFKWYLFKYKLCCWTDSILHRLDLKKVDASKKNRNLKVQTDTAIVSNSSFKMDTYLQTDPRLRGRTCFQAKQTHNIAVPPLNHVSTLPIVILIE